LYVRFLAALIYSSTNIPYYYYYYYYYYYCEELLNYFLAYSMEKSPSWETDRFSASQKISCILWGPKFRYRVYNCPPPVPILSTY